MTKDNTGVNFVHTNWRKKTLPNESKPNTGLNRALALAVAATVYGWRSYRATVGATHCTESSLFCNGTKWSRVLRTKWSRVLLSHDGRDLFYRWIGLLRSVCNLLLELFVVFKFVFLVGVFLVVALLGGSRCCIVCLGALARVLACSPTFELNKLLINCYFRIFAIIRFWKSL